MFPHLIVKSENTYILHLFEIILILLPSVSTCLCRTPLTDTTTCELLPRTKSTLGPVPPYTTLTTAPLQERQAVRPPSVAAPGALEPPPAEEPPSPQDLSPPLDARKPATTPGRLPDCLTSAMPSSTRSPAGVKASSPLPTPPQRPLTSLVTVASLTPLPSWPTTTMATLHTTRPTAWASHLLAWPLWRPAPPTRCTVWGPGCQARGSGPAPVARLPPDQRPGWGSTAAPPASRTPRSTLTTLTADTHSGCRLTCESETHRTPPPPSHPHSVSGA